MIQGVSDAKGTQIVCYYLRQGSVWALEAIAAFIHLGFNRAYTYGNSGDVLALSQRK